MGFGLGKDTQQKSLPREPRSKIVFDDFDGVVVFARWLESRVFTPTDGTPARDSGPSLEITVQNVVPSDDVQRVFLKMGAKFQDYRISEDAMFIASESELNENTGLAVFCNKLSDLGCDMTSKRFNTDEGVNANGFLGLKCHFIWEDAEMTTNKNGKSEVVTYQRFIPTKFMGFENLDEFLASSVEAVKGVVNADIEDAVKDVLSVYCMDTPRTHTEIIAYAKKNAEIAASDVVMGKIKDAAYLTDKLGLTKKAGKYVAA